MSVTCQHLLCAKLLDAIALEVSQCWSLGLVFSSILFCVSPFGKQRGCSHFWFWSSVSAAALFVGSVGRRRDGFVSSYFCAVYSRRPFEWWSCCSLCFWTLGCPACPRNWMGSRAVSGFQWVSSLRSTAAASFRNWCTPLQFLPPTGEWTPESSNEVAHFNYSPRLSQRPARMILGCRYKFHCSARLIPHAVWSPGDGWAPSSVYGPRTTQSANQFAIGFFGLPRWRSSRPAGAAGRWCTTFLRQYSYRTECCASRHGSARYSRRWVVEPFWASYLRLLSPILDSRRLSALGLSGASLVSWVLLEFHHAKCHSSQSCVARVEGPPWRASLLN